MRESNAVAEIHVPALGKKTGIQSQLDRPDVDPIPILHQITMPVADGGGFGLTRAQDIMHIAYVSSLASTIQSTRSIQAFASYNSTDHILPHASALSQQLTQSLACVHQQISPLDYADNDNDEVKDNDADPFILNLTLLLNYYLSLRPISSFHSINLSLNLATLPMISKLA